MPTSNHLVTRVRAIIDETEDTRCFILAAADGRALPPPPPGSHLDVIMSAGLVRQYSLCNGPDDRDTYIITVKREPMSRGGSRFMHDRVNVDDLLEVGTPRNAFPLEEGAAHHLLVAGGIGITPLIAMAKHLAARPQSFALHYFARSARHTAFLPTLKSPPFDTATHLHLGLDPAATRAALDTVTAGYHPGAHVYICGPSPFITAVAAAATTQGWPADSIHHEYFTAPQRDSAAPDHAFNVRLEQRGLTIRVEPDETIVSALEKNGVRIAVSCEQGICGTCLTRLLSGTADHRDSYLTDAEKQAGHQICLCVSRSIGETLVLDL